MTASNSRDVLVEVSRVNHFYGKGEARKQALYENDLTVRRGEILIMTGPSGSGKTTLLTLIGTLRAVQEGSIKIGGTELAGLVAKEQVKMRRDIGFIFQAHNLLDSLNARQNVRMAIELSGIPRKTYDAVADQALASVGLEHRVTYKPRNLSIGQRQRVAIARALVNKPRIILADEPTAALDKDSGSNVVRLLRQMADEQGSAIMIVTHDNRILHVADRIVNMVDGRIVSDIRVRETIAICTILRKCPLFKELSPSDLTDVAQKMHDENFDTGDVIIRKGEIGGKFFVIAKGRTEVLVEDVGGSRPSVTLEEGGYFGEVALMRDQPRSATVVAVEPVLAYSLNKGDFLEAMKNHKSFDEQLSAQLFARGG
jgi:putative ABC transport system ATP-binding protein